MGYLMALFVPAFFVVVLPIVVISLGSVIEHVVEMFRRAAD